MNSDLHHKAYVDNGNKLLDGSGHDGKSLEDIVKATYDAGALVQSGSLTTPPHWNHIQFWEMMGPEGRAITRIESIAENFGSVDAFKDQFCAAGAASLVQAGAGWSKMLMAARHQDRNGVNPLCFDQTALLGCDVWNILFIDFRNKRPAGLTNFLDNLVNGKCRITHVNHYKILRSSLGYISIR